MKGLWALDEPGPHAFMDLASLRNAFGWAVSLIESRFHLPLRLYDEVQYLEGFLSARPKIGVELQFLKFFPGIFASRGSRYR